MTSGLVSVLDRLDRAGRIAENAALIVLLGGMVLLSFGQIILREVFETGVIWADEFVRLLVLWLAMVGSIAATRDDRHIRIDALSHLLPPVAVSLTRLVVDLFAAVVCGAIAWHAWRYLQLEIEFEETVLLDTPAWVAHMIVPLALALTAYRFVVLVIRRVAELVSGRPAEAGS